MGDFTEDGVKGAAWKGNGLKAEAPRNSFMQNISKESWLSRPQNSLRCVTARLPRSLRKMPGLAVIIWDGGGGLGKGGLHGKE